MHEQNKGKSNYYTQMLIEKNTHAHIFKHSLKGHVFCLGTQALSLEKILTEERVRMQGVVLKKRWAKNTGSYLYSEHLPSYKYWKKDTGGRGNGQMVHLRNGTPEHRTEYHLLLSDLIPFDLNNCHLHSYHQLCHLHWRHHYSPSHQGFFWLQGGDFWIRSNVNHLV